MRKHSEKIYNDPWERDWYETGSTQPPKDRAGLIALLLMLVIAFGGIATVLGVMNIRLFQMLAAQQQSNNLYLTADSENLAQTQATEAPWLTDTDRLDYLGMEGQTVSQFDRRFYQLPHGYLVTGVQEDCQAQQAGIRTGDVIVAVEGTPIDCSNDLNRALEQLQPGQQAKLKIYRRQLDRELSVTIEIPEEQ